MIRRRQPLAAGMTLTELLVGIAVMAIILGAATVAFVQTARLRAAAARETARIDAADHFLRRLANDVRAGRAVRLSAPGTLVIDGDDAPVTYAAAPGRVTRSAGDGEAVAVLAAPEIAADFAVAAEGATASAVVTLTWPGEKGCGMAEPMFSLRLTPRGGEGRR